MTRWAIGDVQGCFDSLQALLNQLPLQTDDELWFVGDLVNRGPRSLDVLRFIKGLGDRARVVLGNHDLHLLGRYAGITKPKPKDTLDDVLDAADAASLIDWLRAQPLMIVSANHAMVHAGLHPSWSIDLAHQLATEVHDVLAGPNWQRDIADIFGPAPRWSPALQGSKRWRAIVSYLARVRTVFIDGSANPDFDGPLADCPAGTSPWFAVPTAAWRSHHVITGHWAALGFWQTAHTSSLDSGCVWGRQLTALALDDGRVVHSAACDATLF